MHTNAKEVNVFFLQQRSKQDQRFNKSDRCRVPDFTHPSIRVARSLKMDKGSMDWISYNKLLFFQPIDATGEIWLKSAYKFHKNVNHGQTRQCQVTVVHALAQMS